MECAVHFTLIFSKQMWFLRTTISVISVTYIGTFYTWYSKKKDKKKIACSTSNSENAKSQHFRFCVFLLALYQVYLTHSLTILDILVAYWKALLSQRKSAINIGLNKHCYIVLSGKEHLTYQLTFDQGQLTGRLITVKLWRKWKKWKNQE